MTKTIFDNKLLSAIFSSVLSITSGNLLQAPPKGPNIPYRPKPHLGTAMILSGNQAYSLPGINSSSGDVSTLVLVQGCGSQTPYSLVVPSINGVTPIAVYDPLIKNGQIQAAMPHLLPHATPEVRSKRFTPPAMRRSSHSSSLIGRLQTFQT